MSKKVILLLSIVVVVINATSLTNEVFTSDSALYASIAKSFSASGNYLDIIVLERDWLDKPHFPYWLCALSINIFGANAFAYKLPSILLFLVSLFYTFKLAEKIYNKETGYLAAIILGSSLHIIISNNDVRAEAILMGLIMGAIYHMYKLTQRFSFADLVLTSLFSGTAIMTKGLFILIIIYSAIFGNMILKGQFKEMLKFRWIFVLLLTFVFIFPELYAVYTQFDLHPEKVVFGRTGVSGLKFFVWDSQFGRFFNTGPIKGSGDPFFFFHTMLWAYAPWVFIGFTALFIYVKELFKRKKDQDYLTLLGFSIMFVIFSASKFQLPHYLNIIYPFISILTASVLLQKGNKNPIKKITNISLNLYAVVYILMIALLEYFFRTDYPVIGITLCIVLTGVIIFFNVTKKYGEGKPIIFAVLGVAIFAIFLNFSFYPSLFKYQSGVFMADFANENYPKEPIIVTHNEGLMEYYSENKLIHLDSLGSVDEAIQKISTFNKVLLYTDKELMDEFTEKGLKYNIIQEYEHYHITTLTKEFIFYKTRPEELKTRYLMEVWVE
ncbi:glycosyltransferase family 39 protein [Flammeovirgaceae bacterium SG7u.111]|nr:glycosyltransferase family 39 protein [Flammeovirgaceae bacterium SG7u.132]WPO34325.1 glycosyltransferase family 39 protein [Flammeovirgaceae bacterium SG7u.111]